MTKQTSRPTLELRGARHADIPGIVALSRKVYGGHAAFRRSMIQGQLNNYPEGQFVVEYEGQIVGHAASFLIDEQAALQPHTWSGITGGGYAARHDPEGEWLYGMEVCVDPDRRRLRIGQRLYDARKELCEREECKGIVFGGRIPNWQRRKKAYPRPEEYIEAVLAQQVNDPVLRFQLRMGFEPIGVLHDYLPSDHASGGHATHLMWRNPYEVERRKRARGAAIEKQVVRVAAVQFQQRRVASVEEFLQNVEYFVDVTSDYRCDFVVFPELFTLQLLALEETRLTPAQSIERLTEYTPRLIEALKQLAISYNINIIGGSHPTRTDKGHIQNIAYVFLRDGSVHAQEKIHPTPSERHWWNIKGGDAIQVIPTDCGPIGVLICYDSEFPELARKLADEGARLLFVPFCTDNRQSYMRVRYCSQARAIENQCYVVLSGNVGNLPGVENMDIQYGESCILTPCDFPFARDGVAEKCTENVETVAVADLDLSDLDWARHEGTVRNLRDRRFDLYSLSFADQD